MKFWKLSMKLVRGNEMDTSFRVVTWRSWIKVIKHNNLWGQVLCLIDLIWWRDYRHTSWGKRMFRESNVSQALVVQWVEEATLLTEGFRGFLWCFGRCKWWYYWREFFTSLWESWEGFWSTFLFGKFGGLIGFWDGKTSHKSFIC